MTSLLLLHGVAALVAPVLMRRGGRRAFLLLAAVPAATTVWLLTRVPAVFGENPPAERLTWVSLLKLHVDFRLDPLAWVMAMIVTGVGALVLIYAAAYFSTTARALGRFGAVFVAFAGAMLGLVTTDNFLVLYVFWELTTVFSYILIGHYHERQASRRAASQAIIITTVGGLAMLAGIVALASMPGGSFTISEFLGNVAAGEFGDGVPPAVLTTTLVLVLLGALSKSALVPFHFWLPAAMAAPTPVSAYLHAAAMVKAGVFLVARLGPAFGSLEVWRGVTGVVGFATMLLGAYRALRQHDLKLLLAFGTVSQLGMLIAILGHGTAATALAGMALVLSHSLFKSTLFLTVGVIDWSVGTRDFRKLSGLGRSMPTSAVVAGIAVLSMAGLPPALGFVAKEAALGALVEDGAWWPLAAFVIGSALTLAYGLRFWFGAFGTRTTLEVCEPRYRSRLIQAPGVVLTVLTLGGGLVPGLVDAMLQPYAASLPGEPGHLQLWHGLTLPLGLTVLVVLAGVGLWLARGPVEELQASVELPSADATYRASLRGLTNVAADITAFVQRGSLPVYLMVILTVMILAGGGAALSAGLLPERLVFASTWTQVPIAVFAVVTAWLAARARRRLKAVVLAGVSGYAVALLYAVHGGPDIALTQVMMETVSLVLFVLVLRRMPTYFTNRPFTRDRWVRIGVATLTGASAAFMGLVAVAGRIHEPVSTRFPELTLEYGYGRNIVNVTLVDTRAWDTLGEISVIVAAATGVASLLFVRDRGGLLDSTRRRPLHQRVRVWEDQNDVDRELRGTAEAHPPPAWLRVPHRDLPWLAASSTIAPRRRSLILEIGTRLIFPTMILVSLYLLFAGHNQPGGGFAGGLVVGTALAVRYLAAGRYELAEAIPVHAGYFLGGGLVLAASAAITPMFFGGAALQTVVLDLTLPVYGDVHLATALFFDIGVYLIVIGLVLDVIRSLGGEIDRHGELEGMSDPVDGDLGAREVSARER